MVSPLTSLASGTTHTIRLNRTSLATVSPQNMYVYNVLNPNKIYAISTWIYDGRFIQFDYSFKAGRYSLKAWYDGYGWGSCSSVINVNPATPFTVTNTQVSIAGGRIAVVGGDISPDSVLKVGGFTGKVVSVGST